MKTLRDILPRASQSLIDANPQLYAPLTDKNFNCDTTGRVEGLTSRSRKLMNRTESEFALILEAQKRKGEILRYEPFGITLRWPCGTHPKTGAPIIIRYTPDFVVIIDTCHEDVHGNHLFRIKYIEVKGGFTGGKFERAIERFRHARTYWPEFTFEMHQKKGGLWKQIL